MKIHQFRTLTMCFLNDLEQAVKSGPDGSVEQSSAVEEVRLKYGMGQGLETITQ